MKKKGDFNHFNRVVVNFCKAQQFLSYFSVDFVIEVF